MSIISSLIAASGTLAAYSRVLEATQNNVANQATPGYAKQRQTLEPLGFDSDLGTGGGVRAGQVQSFRDEYLERSVRAQTAVLGKDEQDVSSLTALQSVFDISGNAGVPNAMSNLFESFSAWAQSPTDPDAKQAVIDRAGEVAGAFHETTAGLANVATNSEQQLTQAVDHVNHLVGQLKIYNQQAIGGSSKDPALDAVIHSTLEELSQFGDFTVLHQEDGTATVLLNGETPLLVGDKQYALRFELAQPSNPAPTYPNARPLAHILASDGTDVTAHATTGQLGSLLDFRNRVVPSYIGDAYQPGALSKMAKEFADNVNTIAGTRLFTYDATDDAKAAQTIGINPLVTPAGLDANDAGPPAVANGIALKLSAMARPSDYGDMAARAGSALRDATNHQEVQQSTVAQAKDLRQQMTGISLDEEATILVQFQRAYEATARMISVLDQLTRSTIDMLHA